MALAVMTQGANRLTGMRTRDQVMDLTRDRSDAERCFNLVSIRTLQRWRKRQREEGHYEPRDRGRWRRGPELHLTLAGALLLFWYQLNVPNAPRRHVQTLLWLERGEWLTLQGVSRERRRLGFTKKKMQYYSGKRNEQQRVDFWTNGPLDGEIVIARRVRANSRRVTAYARAH